MIVNAGYIFTLELVWANLVIKLSDVLSNTFKILNLKFKEEK